MTGTPIQLRDRGGRVVFEGTQDGGGGSVPGARRTLDLGVVDVSDLLAGPVTLYTPDSGEIVGPVWLTDVTLTDTGAAVAISRDEAAITTDDTDHPTLAGWDGSAAVDGVGIIQIHPPSFLYLVPRTSGPVTTGLGYSYAIKPASLWQADTGYLAGQAIIGTGGYIFSANNDGTSGLVEPDWAAAWPNDDAADNDISWHPQYTLPATGSAHVYADVTIPAAP